MKKRIYVTKQDIINGKVKIKLSNGRYRGKICPIAHALFRNKIKFKEVQRRKVNFGHNKKTDLTKKAQEFIKDFDCGLSVRPIRFIIDIPIQNLLKIKH